MSAVRVAREGEEERDEDDEGRPCHSGAPRVAACASGQPVARELETPTVEAVDALAAEARALVVQGTIRFSWRLTR